ncbi:MAG: sigma-54-dependent Fis family transcriptional regulator [Deltaproteobacteria bacterium]|nr:MAG: sigma-54-dependent Fis family transcriptional regulator [Deltaproteobacteria bacterium]
MRILVVDDERDHRECLSNYLENELGHQVTQSKNGKAALAQFQKNPFPMVLSDIRMPEMDGIQLLRKLKELPQGRYVDVVLITGYADMSSAIEALRGGAYDYLMKPIDLIELRAVVNRIAEHQSLLRENYELTHCFEEKLAQSVRETETRLKDLQKAYAEVVGIGEIGVFSKQMKKVMELVKRFREDRTVPVLIEGETGTGKEVVARLLHYGEGEVTAPFVPINVSAISPNLFESELFGYEAGAFTGAKKTGQKGKLELARGGTLFLDEIGDMPLEFQPKLLRVLEDREFFRVGGLKKISLDLRVICATNRNLAQLVKEGSFRKDLYYRLNVARIFIPPLRERQQDIAPLARMFLARYAEQKKRRFKSIHPQAIKILEDYPWPGNVRELENTIERVVLMYDEEEIKPKHLEFLSLENNEIIESQSSALDLDSIVLPSDTLYLEEVEAKIIRKALAKFGGNKSRTAIYLGISRNVLNRKIKKLL